jgi:hypothetical protein
LKFGAPGDPSQPIGVNLVRFVQQVVIVTRFSVASVFEDFVAQRTRRSREQNSGFAPAQDEHFRGTTGKGVYEEKQRTKGLDTDVITCIE